MKVSADEYNNLIQKIYNNSSKWTAIYVNFTYYPESPAKLIFTKTDDRKNADGKFKVRLDFDGILYFEYTHLYQSKIEKLVVEGFRYFVISKIDNNHFIIK